MDEQRWMPGICNETAGFLFRHDCLDPPVKQCQRCNKPICEKHSRVLEDQLLCVQCTKKNLQRQSPDTDRGRQYHEDYYDDPYFYDGYHYDGYHDDWRYGAGSSYYSAMQGDQYDFTDADAESLAAGDEDFENDMSES